jgi:hypothetical protein
VSGYYKISSSYDSIIYFSELQSSHSPSSKNQKRRLKRKQREEVGGGLDAIQAAISALESDSGIRDGDQDKTGKFADKLISTKIKVKPGQIGEGKGIPLKQNQRKRAL